MQRVTIEGNNGIHEIPREIEQNFETLKIKVQKKESLGQSD